MVRLSHDNQGTDDLDQLRGFKNKVRGRGWREEIATAGRLTLPPDIVASTASLERGRWRTPLRTIRLTRFAYGAPREMPLPSYMRSLMPVLMSHQFIGKLVMKPAIIANCIAPQNSTPSIGACPPNHLSNTPNCK